MEPMYIVSYYLQLQRRLVASKGSLPKRLVDLPAVQQLNSLQPGQALLGLGAIDQAEMKPPRGSNPVAPLEVRDILAVASEEVNFEQPDNGPLRIQRLKARLTEIAWAFLLIAGLVTFSLACLLSPTLLG
jgi:hypothetical protein